MPGPELFRRAYGKGIRTRRAGAMPAAMAIPPKEKATELVAKVLSRGLSRYTVQTSCPHGARTVAVEADGHTAALDRAAQMHRDYCGCRCERIRG